MVNTGFKVVCTYFKDIFEAITGHVKCMGLEFDKCALDFWKLN